LHELAYVSFERREGYMYKIEKTDYGFRLEFEGFIKADEMREWYEESKQLLENTPRSFHVMVDIRKMKTLPPDAKKIFEEGQRDYASKGGIRSAVIASDVITKEQLRNIGVRSGVTEFEKYIDGSQPDWEQKALDWLIHRIPPE
jgi:hypothetical protein